MKRTLFLQHIIKTVNISFRMFHLFFLDNLAKKVLESQKRKVIKRVDWARMTKIADAFIKETEVEYRTNSVAD